jgi:hypothetical protein
VRSALAEVLAYRGYGDENFARDFETITQTAAADAKRSFPHDPGKAHLKCMAQIRNNLWERFNGFALPLGAHDINQCAVTHKQTYEGPEMTGLVKKRNTANGTAGKPQKPKS